MFKAEYWMFSTLFACGVIAGLSYLLLSDSNPVPRAASSHEVSDPENNPEIFPDNLNQPGAPAINDSSDAMPSGDVASLIEEGDAFLVAENYAAASKRYLRAQQQTGRITNEVSLRMAFCAEFNHQYRAAADHYNRVAENRPTDIQRWIARSGLSRCWLERGNRRESLAILCDLFLESLDRTSIPQPLQAQFQYQLGRGLQDVALQNYHYDLSRPDGVAFHSVAPWMEELLLLVDPTHAMNSSQLQTERLTALKESVKPQAEVPETQSLASQHPQIVIVQRPTESLELTTIDIQSPLVSIAELTRHLAAAGELELHVSPEAAALITARSRSVNGRSVPVSLILDSLLLPLNVVWFQDEKGLFLHSLAENAELSSRYFPAAMERVYRRFMVTVPGDYRVASALLARANLKLIQEDLNQAAVHYQELLQRNPKEELLAKVFFNLGKIEMRLGRNDQALKLFYRTADQSYRRELQSAAYWLAGQVCLEQRNLPDSIRAAGRSLALAQIDEQRRLAALTLARAYLVSNQPLSANQVLFDNRQAFAGSSLEPSAAVIGSLARYLGMTDKSNLNSESNRLLTAIAMAPPDQYQHFLDIYTAARAWQELGFRDRAIEMLTLAADSTTIPAWRRQFLFELGVQLVLTQQAEKAVPVFEFLTSGEEDEWIDKSLSQLSLLYLQLERYPDTIAVGEKALARKIDENQRQSVLQTMGKAYRELGQHHAAAVCFAGMFPKQSEKEWE